MAFLRYTPEDGDAANSLMRLVIARRINGHSKYAIMLSAGGSVWEVADARTKKDALRIRKRLFRLFEKSHATRMQVGKLVADFLTVVV